MNSPIDDRFDNLLGHHGFKGNLSFPPNENFSFPFPLPTGYRFDPFDDQLIIHYLSPKLDNKPIPASMITDVNVYQFDPMKLSETHVPQGEGKWYSFSSRERKYKNGSRPNRVAGDGYWKASGVEKEVKHEGLTIGHKMSLAYYKGKPPNGEKTNWLMHEYTLHNAPQRQRCGPDDMKLDDFVLCKIYETKYKSSSRKRKGCDGEGND